MMSSKARRNSPPHGVKSLIAIAAALATAALAAGCKTAGPAIVSFAPEYSHDYRERHPIAINENAKVLELFVGSLRGELNGTQRREVAIFAQEWRREATGGIVIEVPTGTPNARAAQDSLHEARAILAAAGVPKQSIRVVPYRPHHPSQFATLRVNYPRIAASAGPCGLWPHDLGPSSAKNDFENRPYWNLGCASQRNLAAMVDDPADLIQPRGMTGVYQGRRTTVLEKYRKGESPSTVYANESKGKISDVGQ